MHVFIHTRPPSLLPLIIGDTPTLLHLVEMKGVPDAIGQIADKYYIFGMHLLQDSNGVKVDVIKRDHTHEGTESITREILKKWLRDGGPTCTYPHLINCLRKSELGALADEISGQLERKEAHDSVQHCRISSQYIRIFSQYVQRWGYQFVLWQAMLEG